jgi:hypothetical protein
LVGLRADKGGHGGGTIVCNCTHLTDFASQLDQTLDLAADVLVSVGDVSLADVLKNILVLVVLLVVWGAMVAACIYSRYLDGLDKKKVIEDTGVDFDLDFG